MRYNKEPSFTAFLEALLEHPGWVVVAIFFLAAPATLLCIGAIMLIGEVFGGVAAFLTACLLPIGITALVIRKKYRDYMLYHAERELRK